MKKYNIIAALLGCLAGGAHAQSSVILYGIADGDVRLDHTNVGTLKSLGSGGESGSRWGIRGSEDLGNGLRATFTFEQGIDLSDNGAPQGNVGGGASAGVGGLSSAPHTSSGTRLFGRIATVGLSGPYGYLRFGRDYSPLYLLQATADPFGGGFVGQVSNIYINDNSRNDNAIFYDSPRTYGIQVSGAVQLGESTTNVTTPQNSTTPAQAKRGNDHYGAGIKYTNGPLLVGVGYEQVRPNIDNYRVNTGDAVASYDFGIVKLAAFYWKTKNSNPNNVVSSPALVTGSTVRLNQNAYSLGATVPFGAFSFLGQAGYLKDKSTSNINAVLGTPSVKYYSVGFRYSLSKRTILYGAYAGFHHEPGPLGNPYQGYFGFIDASNSGLFTNGNLLDAAGHVNVNPWSAQFGIRHSF